MYFAIVFVYATITNVAALQIPNYFPRCYVDDPDINSCILKAGNDLKMYIQKGVDELELPSFDPIVFPTVHLKYDMQNTHIMGILQNTTFGNMFQYEMNNIEFHPKDITLKGQIKFPVLPYSTYFIIEGILMNLPVNGEGTLIVSMKDLTADFVINADLVKRDGVEYCKIRGFDLNLDISDMCGKFYLTVNSGFGLTNELLKENSKAISKTVSPFYGEYLGFFVKRYLVRFCDNVPYADLFPTSPSA